MKLINLVSLRKTLKVIELKLMTVRTISRELN